MRLGSHLSSLKRRSWKEDAGPGRKMGFLTQEMNRETNTIGSKAGDGHFTACCRDQGDYRKNPETVENVE